MFKPLCEKIVTHEIKEGFIDIEKKDDYTYGMNVLFNITLNIISMVLIGCIMNRLWECIVFCLVYKVMRKYTGGFHCKSAVHCYIVSCIMYFLAIAASIYIPFEIYIGSAIVVLSMAVIWVLSPIEAVNKPLDNCERQVFKKRARISVAVILAIYAVSLFISVELSKVIAIAVVSVLFFAILGEVKLINHKRKFNTQAI